MHLRKLLIILIIMASAITAAAQNVQSIYTDLRGKGCKTLELVDESGGYQLDECKGIGGYKIHLMSSDRANVEVVAPDGSKHDLNLGQVGSGGFSGVGAKAEWRVKKEGGKLVPIALILRFNVLMDSSRPEKETSFLVVSKITPREVCRIGRVEPGPNQNQEARRMADSSASQPCIKPL